MIVPSIDLMDGQTVQLVGGAEKALDAGDPRPLRFYVRSLATAARDAGRTTWP